MKREMIIWVYSIWKRWEIMTIEKAKREIVTVGHIPIALEARI